MRTHKDLHWSKYYITISIKSNDTRDLPSIQLHLVFRKEALLKKFRDTFESYFLEHYL